MGGQWYSESSAFPSTCRAPESWSDSVARFFGFEPAEPAAPRGTVRPPLTAAVHTELQRLSPSEVEEITADTLVYRNLRRTELEEVQRLHGEWFPIDYEKTFFDNLFAPNCINLGAFHRKQNSLQSKKSPPKDILVGIITISRQHRHIVQTDTAKVMQYQSQNPHTHVHSKINQIRYPHTFDQIIPQTIDQIQPKIDQIQLKNHESQPKIHEVQPKIHEIQPKIHEIQPKIHQNPPKIEVYPTKSHGHNPILAQQYQTNADSAGAEAATPKIDQKCSYKYFTQNNNQVNSQNISSRLDKILHDSKTYPNKINPEVQTYAPINTIKTPKNSTLIPQNSQNLPFSQKPYLNHTADIPPHNIPPPNSGHENFPPQNIRGENIPRANNIPPQTIPRVNIPPKNIVSEDIWREDFEHTGCGYYENFGEENYEGQGGVFNTKEEDGAEYPVHSEQNRNYEIAQFAYILTIGVVDELRGKGIASRLIREAIKKCMTPPRLDPCSGVYTYQALDFCEEDVGPKCPGMDGENEPKWGGKCEKNPEKYGKYTEKYKNNVEKYETKTGAQCAEVRQKGVSQNDENCIENKVQEYVNNNINTYINTHIANYLPNGGKNREYPNSPYANISHPSIPHNAENSSPIHTHYRGSSEKCHFLHNLEDADDTDILNELNASNSLYIPSTSYFPEKFAIISPTKVAYPNIPPLSRYHKLTPSAVAYLSTGVSDSENFEKEIKCENNSKIVCENSSKTVCENGSKFTSQNNPTEMFPNNHLFANLPPKNSSSDRHHSPSYTLSQNPHLSGPPPPPKAIYLHVIDYNSPAVRLYESLNFVRLAHLSNFYDLAGSQYGAYLYARYLS